MPPESAHPASEGPTLTHTPSGDARRRALVVAACQQIADKGLEGFRVREVATQVGINNATLHYYFPTKEALIRAVVGYILELLNTIHASDVPPEPQTAQQALERYFADVLYQMQTFPELFQVLIELNLRARRDEAIHAILVEADRAWYTNLSTMLEAGIKQGALHAGLDVHRATLTIMAMFKGLTLQIIFAHDERQQFVEQLAGWLRA